MIVNMNFDVIITKISDISLPENQQSLLVIITRYEVQRMYNTIKRVMNNLIS